MNYFFHINFLLYKKDMTGYVYSSVQKREGGDDPPYSLFDSVYPYYITSEDGITTVVD
jgi:hypothetical protein